MAADPAYVLRLEAAEEAGRLTVAPRVQGPAGASLRYEMSSDKSGGAGKSSTSQSGRVSLDQGGAGALSTLRLGVSPGDRYVITVKIFDGARLVAEDVLRYPR